ncbi:MAG: J domain-containing protein [Prevotella sp.]|nr:J domain-containing protein [Prevotella sp.]
MFKDYYKILGITPAATQEEIKKAYRSQSLQWHPDKNPGMDTTAKMQDINEAYNILKDAATRERYDAEYARFSSTRFEQQKSAPKAEANYDINDDTLKEDIKEARKAAEDYVREFYASLKKDTKKAARGAWDEMKGYLIFSVIMSFIVMAVITCSGRQSPAVRLAELNSMDYSALLTEGSDKPSDPPVPRKLPAMQVNDANHWESHTFFNAFSIKVPVTVELQTKDSPYVRQITSRGYQSKDDVVVFNQKGLCNLDQKAQKQYCRIMFSYYQGVPGDFLRRTETEVLDAEYDQLLREMVIGEIGPNGRLMGTINYQWVRINNANAILVSYKRTGNNFDTTIPVNCKMLIIQDNNRFVKMMLSYREKEANLWADDFEQVLRSFEWKN